MPTCQNCHHKWSWTETIKKTTTLDPAMVCPYCGEKQFQTQKSRWKIAMLPPIVLLPLLIQIFFDVPRGILLSLFPVLFILVLVLYPFLVNLSNEETYIGEH